MSIYNKNGSILNSAYNKSGSLLASAYDVDGINVFGNSINYDNYTASSLYTISTQNCQGIAVYNNVLFQFRASGTSVTDKVCLFDLSDGSVIIRDMTIKSDHGDSATFSTEFYDQNDEFPLIYVTADTTPAKIYVNRVSRSSSTLIKTLVFPQTAGYYGAGAFDWENNICYLLAYKENNYQSDDGGANTTVVSKWDMSNLTNNGDNTYTPAFISQYERDYIYVMQGLEYHDGYVWIASGIGGAAQHIYAMNPRTGVIDHTITMDNTEIEGLAFVSDYMITGQQGGIYKKYTFATT